MKKLSNLFLLSFLIILGLFSCWGKTPTAVSVTIGVHADQPGLAIPRDFPGFSFEAGSLTSATRFQAENPVFQRLVAQLAPALLRFGGNSGDRTGWRRGVRTANTPDNVLVSSDVDRVFALARATGCRVLFSLNLAALTKEAAADEADYVFQTGSDVLYGFELGNEPNQYGLKVKGHRPPSYSLNNYISEYRAFADAIQARTPRAVLTGPAAAGQINSWTTPFVRQMGSRIAMVTQHTYALSHSMAGTDSPLAPTIANLLSSGVHDRADSQGAQLQQIARAAGLPWRMAETNSCGGGKGVSDVFASALWGVDYMFTLAGRGAAGVNFHSPGAGSYTAIAVNGSQVSPRPLYYAMLLFRVAARGRLVPLDLKTSGSNLTAFGTLDDDGTLRITVINKDREQDAVVRINPGAAYTRATALRLRAPALDATADVTLGEAAVQADGSWAPSRLEAVARDASAFTTTLRAGSAVLLSFSADARDRRR
jgi:hypothetical protein